MFFGGRCQPLEEREAENACKGNCKGKGPDAGKVLEGLWHGRASVAGFSGRGRRDMRGEKRSERQLGAGLQRALLARGSLFSGIFQR